MKVLLISHEASFTGAPRSAILVAASLISGGHEVTFLSRRPGPLFQDFEAIAETHLEPLWRIRRRLEAISAPVLSNIAWMLTTALVVVTIFRSGADLVYINSTSAAIYLRPALWMNKKVVLHVRESRPVFLEFFRRARLHNVPQDVLTIACSAAIQSELSAESCVKGRVFRLDSMPNPEMVKANAMMSPEVEYDATGLVIGSVGTIENRKGTDLWLEIAARIVDLRPNIAMKFVWVGPGNPPKVGGLPVEFAGATNNPHRHVTQFDIAFVTSRDEPLGQVVGEAMILGKPVIAFAVGGIPSQLDGAGVLVDPENVELFAQEAVKLIDDPDLRARVGEMCRRRAEELFDVKVFAARLLCAVQPETVQEAYDT